MSFLYRDWYKARGVPEEYKIVKAEFGSHDLEEKVNELINKGWKIRGGPVLNWYRNYWYQAMVLKNKL